MKQMTVTVVLEESNVPGICLIFVYSLKGNQSTM